MIFVRHIITVMVQNQSFVGFYSQLRNSHSLSRPPFQLGPRVDHDEVTLLRLTSFIKTMRFYY